MKRVRKDKKGFTLIEMIVVIVIIAILVALAVPSILGFVQDARDSKFMASARVVFSEVDLKTVDVIGELGVFTEGANSTEKELSARISDYYQKPENQVMVGDYRLYSAFISPHFDYNETNAYKFDRTKDQHELTKLGVMFAKVTDSGTDYIFVVIKRSGDVKVFHDKFDEGETFDENSEWYINWRHRF